MTRAVSGHARETIHQAVSMQLPDEVIRLPGQEGRQTAAAGRAEQELADADVPAEVGRRDNTGKLRE
jgi:hypothetical protein